VLGLNNPGGKLPISFPRAEGAIPCYYHQLSTRNNYVDAEGQAAYSFGYGLSYTTFEIGKPTLQGNVVSTTVKNTGARKGDEVVQMYVKDVKFSVAQPEWAIRGFKRVTLDPGETKTVTFTLGPDELGFWNLEREFVVEPGEFKILLADHFNMAEFQKSKNTVSYWAK